MTARFAISYEEFTAHATAAWGAEWAANHGADYARHLTRRYRELAGEAATPEDVAALHRLADRMDPDLHKEATDAAA